MLQLLARPSLERLLHYLGMYTLGLADCESADHEREWARILKEKYIALPIKEPQ